LTPNDFLHYGKELIDNGDSEIHFRTAASRIYYSSYHSVKAVVDTFCNALSVHDDCSGGIHSQLLYRLRTKCKDDRFKSSLNSIQTALKLAREIRVTADYELNEAFTKRKAKDAYLSAQKISTSIIQLNNNLGVSTPPDLPASPKS